MLIRALKYVVGTVLMSAMIAAFAVFVLEVPVPWKSSAEAAPPSRPLPSMPSVRLVEWFKFTDNAATSLRESLRQAWEPEAVGAQLDAALAKLTPLKGTTLEKEPFLAELGKRLDAEELKRFQDLLLKHCAVPSHTLEVPPAVQRSLGIRRANKENLASPWLPTESRPLVLPGSTALDPARIVRVRARFAPAEVVKIAERRDFSKSSSQFRELRPGDEVKKGEELGVFYSVDVGTKKNDLFEAILQYRLDKVILEKAEGSSSVPEVFLWNARRNVQTDRSAIIRAKNTLKVWNISDQDIEAVVKEAEQLSLTERQQSSYKDADWGEQQEKWARVVLKAPCDGVIVERNVSRGETVVDNTLSLFTVAQVDKIAILANLPEDDLPLLEKLTFDERKWLIETVGAREPLKLHGTIDEIGQFIDPNQHTAVIKGYIDNPKVAEDRNERKLRAGQFVSATVNLPPPRDVVEIPISALVEDGKQSLVFVQTDAQKHYYTMRRVEVTQRFDKSAYVRSTPLPPDKQLTAEEKELGFLPKEPLQISDPVLTSGTLELKAALLEKEGRQRQKN